MHSKSIEKLMPSSLEANHFDLVICASGYESRATHLILNYKISSKRKVALLFDDKIDEFYRTVNDKIFEDNGFELIQSNGDSGDEVVNILDTTIFEGLEIINILIDYSSMTRIWYASLIKYFKDKPLKDKEVFLYCSYSCANFNFPPEEIVPNINVGPIPGFSNLSISNKPTALIIGLGYEIDRAYGLTEYLDAETYLFYTSSKNNNQFSNLIENNNEDLIRSVPDENIFIYDFDDIEYIFFVLHSLCERLSKSNRIVLAPCGPKPFTLICFIVSEMLPNIDVWRISSGKKSIPIDRIPSNEIILFKHKINKKPCSSGYAAGADL